MRAATLRDDGKTFLWAGLVLALMFAPFFSSLSLWSSGTDLVHTYFPYRAFMRRCLLDGQWPLWNPYLGVGIPVQTGIRSLSNPFILATLWLPTSLHVKATIYLHSLLSTGLTACMLMRQGMSRPAALTGGLIYGISGFAIGRIYAGHLDWTEILPYLPLVVWGSLNAISRPGLGWTVLWSAYIALLTISGHYQFVYMAGLSLLFFHLLLVLSGFRNRVPALNWRQPWESTLQVRQQVASDHLLAAGVARAERLRDLGGVALRWLLAGVFSFALSAFQVLPAVQSLANTNRLSNPKVFAAGLQPAVFWLTALLPRFFDGKKVLLWWSSWPNTEAQAYLGISALLFLGLALVHRHWRCWLPLLGAALFAAWLSLGPGYGLHDLLVKLDPFLFKNFRASCRWTIVFAFYGAWLAALGVDSLRSGKTWLALVFPGIPLAATLIWLLSSLSHPDDWTRFVLAISDPAQAGVLTNPQGEYLGSILDRAFSEWSWSAGLCLAAWGLGLLPRSRRAWAAFLLLALDLGILLKPYLVMAPEPALGIYPQVQSTLAAQLGPQRVMWDPQLGWLDRGMLYRFSEMSFLDSSANPAMVIAFNLSRNAPAELPMLLMEPWSNHGIWDIEGVSLVVGKGGAPPWPGLEPVDPANGVYRNPKAFGRVYMTGQTEWLPDRLESLRRLAQDPARAARLTLVNLPEKAPTAAANPRYTIEKLEIQPNRVLVQLTQQGDGMLVLSDAWWPGWGVRVDGHEQTLYGVNGCLHRGVWLTSGAHKVEFYYWPGTLTVGLVISLLSALLLGIWLWLPRGRSVAASQS